MGLVGILAALPPPPSAAALVAQLLATLPAQSSRVQAALGAALSTLAKPLGQEELHSATSQLLSRVRPGACACPDRLSLRPGRPAG